MHLNYSQFVLLTITEENLPSILEKWSDYLVVNNIISLIFRTLGFWLIKFLVMILNAVTTVFSGVFSFFDFSKYDWYVSFANSYKAVVIALFTVGLAYIGLKLIRNGPNMDKQSILTNIVVSLMIVVGLPTISSTISSYARTYGQQTGNPSTAVLETLQENIIDMKQIAKHQSFEDPIPTSTQVRESDHKYTPIKKISDLKTIDIVALIDKPDDYTDHKSNEVLTKKLERDDGKLSANDLKNGFTKIIDEYYYQYAWRPWTILLILGTLTLVIVITAIKCARFIAEIGLFTLIGQGFLLADLEDPQKTKNFVSILMKSFLTLFLSCFMVLFYTKWISFIQQTPVVMSTKMIGIIAGMMITLEGPTMLQTFLGVNIGLGSTVGGLARLAAGGYAAKKLLGTGPRFARKGAGLALSTAGAAKRLPASTKSTRDAVNTFKDYDKNKSAFSNRFAAAKHEKKAAYGDYSQGLKHAKEEPQTAWTRQQQARKYEQDRTDRHNNSGNNGTGVGRTGLDANSLAQTMENGNNVSISSTNPRSSVQNTASRQTPLQTRQQSGPTNNHATVGKRDFSSTVEPMPMGSRQLQTTPSTFNNQANAVAGTSRVIPSSVNSNGNMRSITTLNGAAAQSAEMKSRISGMGNSNNGTRGLSVGENSSSATFSGMPGVSYSRDSGNSIAPRVVVGDSGIASDSSALSYSGRSISSPTGSPNTVITSQSSPRTFANPSYAKSASLESTPQSSYLRPTSNTVNNRSAEARLPINNPARPNGGTRRLPQSSTAQSRAVNFNRNAEPLQTVQQKKSERTFSSKKLARKDD